ncbi:MAG: ABC transporter permease, partial [Burkholderiaceae bacterium]
MLRQIRTIAFYTLLEALRNRLMWLIVVIALIGIGISGFLNALAITESRQIQLALLAAFLRFSAVFLIATFVVTSMVREFNDKGLELVLALPLPRVGYLFGKLTGFALLAFVPTVLFGLLTLLFTPPLQSTLWMISLLCELWIVAAFSLLCVLTFNQIMTALSAVMAFYLLARSITALQLMGNSSQVD